MKKIYNWLDYYPAMFIDMVECDGYIWFAACNYNGLFRMDCESGKIKYMGRFPTEEEGYLYSAIVSYNEKLFFVPSRSKAIFEYDVRSGKFNTYKVDYDEECAIFCGAGQYQKYLFFWSHVSFDIIRFDMEEKKIRIINVSELHETLGDISISHEYGKLWRGYSIVGNHLYIPSPGKSIVLDVDMKKDKVSIHRVPGMEGYLTICYDGKKFWLSGLENYLVTWSPDTKHTEKFEIDENVPVKNARLCIYDHSQIFYSLANSRDLLVLSVDNMKFGYILNSEEEARYRDGKTYSYKIIMLKKLHNVMWSFDYLDCKLKKIGGGEWAEYKTGLVYGRRHFIRDRLISSGIYEIQMESTESLGLNGFVEYVQEWDVVLKKFENNSVDNGKYVYDAIKGWKK